LEIQARWYSGWKDVVRMDCKNPKNALCFPSPESCPYRFPSYSKGGWNAYNSVLVFITTEPFETFTTDSVKVDGKDAAGIITGCWWKSRLTNDGGWVGMEEKGVPPAPRLPFTVPPYSNAIIQIGTGTMPKTVELNGVTLNVLDGWANPYAWPVNWVPVVVGAGAGAAIGAIAGYFIKPLGPAVSEAVLALIGGLGGAAAGYLTATINFVMPNSIPMSHEEGSRNPLGASHHSRHVAWNWN